MKIIYNKKEFENDIQKIITENIERVDLKLEFQPPPQKIQKPTKEYKGPPIGGIGMPEFDGLIDLSQNLFNFIISKEIAQGIIGTAIWELIVKIFKFTKKNSWMRDSIGIITDQYKVGDVKNNICFTFSMSMSSEEFEKIIKEIPEVRSRLLSLLELAEIEDPNIYKFFSFSYINGRWHLYVLEEKWTPKSGNPIYKKSFFSNIILHLTRFLKAQEIFSKYNVVCCNIPN